HHQVEPGAEDLGARLAGLLRPARKRRIGLGDRLARLLGAEAWHLGDTLAGCRVGHLDCRRSDPLTADEALLAEKRFIPEFHGLASTLAGLLPSDGRWRHGFPCMGGKAK